MRPDHPCRKRLPSPPEPRPAMASPGTVATPGGMAADTGATMAEANTAAGVMAVAVAVSWAIFSIETSGPGLRFGNPWRTVSTKDVVAFSPPTSQAAFAP